MSVLGWFLGKLGLNSLDQDLPSQPLPQQHPDEESNAVLGASAFSVAIPSDNTISPVPDARALQPGFPPTAPLDGTQNTSPNQHLHLVQNTQTAGVISSIKSNTFQAHGDIRLTMENSTVNHHYGKTENSTAADVAGCLGKDLPPTANFRALHKEISCKVVAESGNWFLQGDIFANWLSEPVDTAPLLWGIGTPRVGKTSLSSLVIDRLLKEANASFHRDQQPVTTVYTYCRHDDGLTVAHILTAMLKQLVENHAAASRKVEETIYTSCMKEGTRPNQKELCEALQRVIALFSRVFVVVDGIDELAQGEQSELMSILLALRVKAFVTSREMTLQGVPQHIFTIQPPAQTVEKVISSQVTDALRTVPLPNTVDRAKIVRDISTQIQRGSDGLFLLAEPQLSALIAPDQPVTTLKGLRQIVQQLSSFPRDAYEKTLRRIQDQTSDETRSLAFRAILLLTHTSRPLDVSELLDALSIDSEFQKSDAEDQPSKDMVINACLGLVTVDSHSGVTSLVHPTARKFFEELKDPLFSDPHTFMANLLAAYLSSVGLATPAMASYHSLEAKRNEFPFFDYAYWMLGHHSQKSLCCPHSKLPEHVVSFFREHQTMVLRPNPDDGTVLDEGSIIHFAALHGLISLYFVDRGREYRGRSALGYTPLYYACVGQHPHFIEQVFALIQDDADEDARSDARRNNEQPGNGDHSLHLADDWNMIDKSELAYESLFGCSEVDVNRRFTGGQTLLHIASRLGQPSVARQLLRCDGIDVNAVDHNGHSALHSAAAKGDRLVVEQLLAVPEIEVNLKEQGGFTPLHLAAQNGHYAAVNLFLAHPGIDPNIQQNEGFTALHIAAQNGHLEVVQLFLNNPKVSRNPVTAKGSTPLHMAAQNGQAEVVKLLLASPGVDTQARTRLGFSILHLAAEKGHPIVAQMLLNTPGAVDIGATTNKRSNALHLAAQNGHESIVGMLLERPEIDVCAKTVDGWTALHFSAQSGKEEIVRMILNCPDIPTNDRGRRPHGETPIGGCNAQRA